MGFIVLLFIVSKVSIFGCFIGCVVAFDGGCVNILCVGVNLGDPLMFLYVYAIFNYGPPCN